ncbi:four helix bundle protein [Flaviaesturariibacter terrae]
MPTFTRYQDIEAWQIAREICRLVFRLTQKEPFARDFKHKDQINDAAGSIMDNIAEGFGRGGNAEFAQFLEIALGSNNEVESQGTRALDKEYITESDFTELSALTEKERAKLIRLIHYLKSSPIKGPKFRTQPKPKT